MKIINILLSLMIGSFIAVTSADNIAVAQSPDQYQECEVHYEVVGNCVCSASKSDITNAYSSRHEKMPLWSSKYAWVVKGGIAPCYTRSFLTPPVTRTVSSQSSPQSLAGSGTVIEDPVTDLNDTLSKGMVLLFVVLIAGALLLTKH